MDDKDTAPATAGADTPVPAPSASEPEEPKWPVSKADLKKFRALVTPVKIGKCADLPITETQDWQALGPILDRLISNQ